MSASQRRQGAQWERDLVNLFTPLFPPGEVRRVLQSQGGAVVGSDLTVGPWFAVEAKSGLNPPYRAALRQAEKDNPLPRSRWPVAIVRQKRDPEGPVVVMRLSTFVAIIKVMRGKE